MLNARSLKSLEGVHPDLVRVVTRAAELVQAPLGFVVIEGLRTPKRQAELVKAGASRTQNSRHLTGHAVDLMATVAGQGRWDWPLYPQLADAMKRAAAEFGVPIVWGGDWKSLRDGPHFELDRRKYP